MFSIKSQTVSILGLAGHKWSLSSVWFCVWCVGLFMCFLVGLFLQLFKNV